MGGGGDTGLPGVQLSKNYGRARSTAISIVELGNINVFVESDVQIK